MHRQYHFNLVTMMCFHYADISGAYVLYTFLLRPVFKHQSAESVEISTYIGVLLDREGMSSICSSAIFTKENF